MRFLSLPQGILAFLMAILPGFMNAQNRKPVTLEDIYLKGTFAAKGVSGFTSMKDGKYFCKTDDRQNILRYEFKSGNLVDTILHRSDLFFNGAKDPISLEDFSFSSDESKILIASQMQSIYRHSFDAEYYVFDCKSRSLSKPIASRIRLAEFSPDGNKIAYVKNNDLYMYHLILNQEERITKDGKINAVINGSTDWVYEEEFAIWKGFYWSPNSDRIAFYRFDESRVKEYSMPIYGNLYPTNETFKYPKAGEDNSIINVFVYDLRSQQTAEMDIGKETNIYIPRIQWSNDNSMLCITRLNRLQNKMDILKANASSGATQLVYSEENKFYVDVPDQLYFTGDGKSFLISSERDGHNHLYLYDIQSGKLRKQITKGDFDIESIYGIDHNQRIYYISSESNTKQRDVYSIGLNGKNKTRLTSGKGWNTASFNADFTIFLCTNSGLNSVPEYRLMDNAGNSIRVLEENKKLNDRLKEFAISPAQFTHFKNSEGTELNAWIIYPQQFDSTRKYPVLMYAYNGPGHQLVVDRWMGSNYYYYQYLAQQGYIIVCCDGRGTGFRGELFKKCTYLQLGKFEIADQIDVARSLQGWSFVDSTRIGFWGWSFGGYMASLAITKGADIFKTAIAVAPVTNWRYYDNIYTERYMRTPQENGKNYDENSPIQFTEKIKGNYLIIHGTADDNVHFQNSAEMVDAMIRQGIRFDSEYYPNKNHGISGGKTRYHLYDRMSRYLLEKL